MEYGLQMWTKKLEWADTDHNCDIKIDKATRIWYCFMEHFNFYKTCPYYVPYINVKCKITQAPFYSGHIGEGRAHVVLLNWSGNEFGNSILGRDVQWKMD